MSSTKTGIEWCDGTIETQIGCTKASSGCDHCYAATLVHQRLSKAHPSLYGGLTTTGADGTPRFNGVIRERPQGLVEILKAERGSRIFLNSRSDTFHESASFEYIAATFGCMAARPDVTFIVLTKRPERAVEWFDWVSTQGGRAGALSLAATCQQFTDRVLQHIDDESPRNRMHRTFERRLFHNVQYRAWPLANVILGASVENQATADERIPHLLTLPGRRMLSCEPLLGPVDLRKYILRDGDDDEGFCPKSPDGVHCEHWWDCDPCHHCGADGRQIHWVIVGGESGKTARPMHPDWARSLCDQCIETGTPFFFKQWGDWREPTRGEPFNTGRGRAQRTPAFIVASDGTCHCFHNDNTAIGAVAMLRVGKRAAGRLLDGVEHNEVPK